MTRQPGPRGRIAANPIPYWATAGKTVEVFDRAFRDLQRIGFTAVKADVPEGMSADDYREWIQGYGLAPALSLFNSPFDETVDMAAELQRARAFARAQAELGLDRTMVSSMSLPARKQRPGIGADARPERFAQVLDNVGKVCVALQEEGVRPLLHSHVGGAIEVEPEITAVMDQLGPDVIGFGPDTGHLRVAGIDVAAIIRRYADRIGGIHIKDVYADYLEPSAREGLDYDALGATKRLWAEPGRGVIDFDEVMAALPAGFDGDLMIEVDVPSVESVFESHRISYEWAQRALGSSSQA